MAFGGTFKHLNEGLAVFQRDFFSCVAHLIFFSYRLGVFAELCKAGQDV